MWLEVWNIYKGTRVAYQLSLVLALIKYQTIVTKHFDLFPPLPCLKYDTFFRKQAALDHSMRWDIVKDDLFGALLGAHLQLGNHQTAPLEPMADQSWCVSYPRPLPPSQPLTPQQAGKFADVTTRIGARWGMNADMPTHGTGKVVMAPIQTPTTSSTPLEAPVLGTPLRHAQFEHELVNHSNREWVSWLL